MRIRSIRGSSCTWVSFVNQFCTCALPPSLPSWCRSSSIRVQFLHSHTSWTQSTSNLAADIHSHHHSLLSREAEHLFPLNRDKDTLCFWMSPHQPVTLTVNISLNFSEVHLRYVVSTGLLPALPSFHIDHVAFWSCRPLPSTNKTSEIRELFALLL